MPKYNKGTKILISVLKRNIKGLSEEIQSCAVNAVINQRNINVNESPNARLSFSTTNFYSKLSEQACINSVFEKNLNVLSFISFMEKTLYSLENQIMFISFEELEYLFDKINFPNELQIEVLAYILKNNAKEAIKSYTEFQSQLKEQGENAEYYEVLKTKIEEFIEIFDSELTLEECQKRVNSEEYKVHGEQVFKNYQIINEYIDDNYEFVASFELNGLYDAIREMDILPLTKKQMKTIIYAVSEKQIAELNKQNTEEIKKEQKSEIVSKNNQSSIEYGKLRKEENIAIQKLKEFLSEDWPIKFINAEDLVKVMNLLKKANFPDERILKIQKNISKSNDEYTQAELLNKLNETKQKYLTIEELDILQAVESKINDQESCINPLFVAIKENYEFVKAELLKLAALEVEDSECVELIKVAIEEIKETIVNYQYSDYRYALELTKQDNQCLGSDTNE